MGGVTTKLTRMAPKRPFTHAEAVAARKRANDHVAETVRKNEELKEIRARERREMLEREAELHLERFVTLLNERFEQPDKVNSFRINTEMDVRDLESILIKRLRETYPFCKIELENDHVYRVTWEDI